MPYAGVSTNRLPIVGGDAGCPSGQDAVAEEGESGASVHLSRDSLGAGADAYSAAVVVGQGEAVVPVHCLLRGGLVAGLCRRPGIGLSAAFPNR